MGVLMGGVEALTPMMALTGQAGVQFAITMENMRNRTGEAGKAAAEVAAGPAAQLTQSISI